MARARVFMEMVDSIGDPSSFAIWGCAISLSFPYLIAARFRVRPLKLLLGKLRPGD